MTSWSLWSHGDSASCSARMSILFCSQGIKSPNSEVTKSLYCRNIVSPKTRSLWGFHGKLKAFTSPSNLVRLKLQTLPSPRWAASEISARFILHSSRIHMLGFLKFLCTIQESAIHWKGSKIQIRNSSLCCSRFAWYPCSIFSSSYNSEHHSSRVKSVRLWLTPEFWPCSDTHIQRWPPQERRHAQVELQCGSLLHRLQVRPNSDWFQLLSRAFK